MFYNQTEMKRYETCIAFGIKKILLIWLQKYNVNLMQSAFVDELTSKLLQQAKALETNL